MSGAKTAVTSLWKVDDRATQTLMVEFYRNLWERKLPKLEALRQAQLKMLRAYDPSTGHLRGPSGEAIAVQEPKPSAQDVPTASRTLPVYWAAWVLSGDPGDWRSIEAHPETELAALSTSSTPGQSLAAANIPTEGEEKLEATLSSPRQSASPSRTLTVTMALVCVGLVVIMFGVAKRLKRN